MKQKEPNDTMNMENVYNVNTFPYDMVTKAPIIKRRKTKNKPQQKSILDLITAFDIETSNDTENGEPVNYMYIWQFAVYDGETLNKCIGRTWDEFRTFMNRLNSIIDDNVCMHIFVHNLSYEFQYLKGVLNVENVFAMEKRKILTFETMSGKFKFLCSYIHSNCSLAEFMKKNNVPAEYQKTTLDYDETRYPWTLLTYDELVYCLNDVTGLVIAIWNEMTNDKDTLKTYPLTSTGYARREAKEALRIYMKEIKPMLPNDPELFDLLRNAFRGGNTHANRYNAGIVIDSEKEQCDINSYDISSSYPAVMLTERYPQKFEKREPDMKVLKHELRHNKACLMKVNLFHVKQKNSLDGCPYIPKHKCLLYEGIEEDNGRILKAKMLQICLTEIDLKILVDTYTFDMEIVTLWTAKKKQLPKMLRDVVFNHYVEKTALKGIEDAEWLYNKTKAILNSFFGMTVQNPIRPELSYDLESMTVEEIEEPIDELLDDYGEKGWLPYQWGVYVSAYARGKLQDAIDMVNAKDPTSFLYCDTDSIKVIGDWNDDIRELNKQYLNEWYRAKDKNGKWHYIGIFEPDGTYKKFSTLGAKKYAYEDMKGELHVTISGVNKKEGPKELKSIYNFKEDFIFTEAGGTNSIYTDIPEYGIIYREGKPIEITPNIYIEDSTYTLGLTANYKELIYKLQTSHIKNFLHYER